MSKSLLFLICLLCTSLLLGCAKSESTTNREGAAPVNSAAPAPSPAATAHTSVAEKIGVPECDAFITAYEACVNDKVPAAARPQFNNSLATWRKSWHELAANPRTKATLVGVCKTSLDQAKQSMKAYGCTF